MSERARANPLLSARRLVFAFAIAFLIGFVDLLFIHLLGIDTLSDLATETLIHGLGLYGALTIIVLFGTDIRF